MQIRYGIVTAQNCFLRGNNSGIEDEVFSGWAVRVFPGTEENGRVKIETHYGYEGYVYKDQLALISRETLICRQDKTRFFRIGVPAADVLDQPKVQGLLLERLLKNSIVERVTDMEPERTEAAAISAGKDPAGKAPAGKGSAGICRKQELADMDGWCLVRTAAGVVGYMHENYLRMRQDDDGYLLETENQMEDGRITYFEKRFQENPPEEESFRDGVVRSARSYLGVQYRWGGKSSLGLDCSGLAFSI
ncbi:MAG: hypothetical protein LUG56_02505 [Lachnospiraceae bacterium]|nr:hypothetical protein [Lachnospiraceae bacterium]